MNQNFNEIPLLYFRQFFTKIQGLPIIPNCSKLQIMAKKWHEKSCLPILILSELHLTIQISAKTGLRYAEDV